MAIAWETIRPGLRSLFEDLGGVQTVWQDKRRPYIDPRGQAVTLLRVRTTETIGTDDRRFADLGLPIPENTIEESQNGYRRTSLDVRVESFRHDDDRFAFNAVSDIRTRLGWLSSLAALREMNVALIRASQAIDLNNVITDDRITSVATLDLLLNIGVCEANTKHPISTIETVNAPVGTFLPPC